MSTKQKVKKFPVFGKKPCSDAFKKLCEEIGSTRVSASDVLCEACGKIHVFVENNPIGSVVFNGKNIVINCECNYLGGIEEGMFG